MENEAQEIPSHQSEEQLLGLQPKETWESSSAIGKNWGERIRDQSLFSARTTKRSYLEMLRRKLADIAARKVVPSVAESALRSALQDLGYRPETGFPDNDGRIPPARLGSITDLSSSRRIALIVDTNVKQARSMGQLASSENPVFLLANPAWRLERTGARKKPRGDWRNRWTAAGNSVGWKGASKSQMVALKTSPIWKALGDGAGGYSDAIQSAFPPFAFGSGLAWTNVGRREWRRICEAEGIDDGMEHLKETAVSAERKRASTEAGTERFSPNEVSRTSAREELHRAIAEGRLAESEIRNGLYRIGKARQSFSGDLDGDSREVGESAEKTERELLKAQEDIRNANVRLSGYLRSVSKEPTPKDRAGQSLFDSRMNAVRDASRKARKIIGTVRESVSAKVSAAVRMLSE